MICILAGDFQEALTFARSQNLARAEWFFPEDEEDIKYRTNFHVLVTGTAGLHVPESYWNRIYALAQQRGRINRS